MTPLLAAPPDLLGLLDAARAEPHDDDPRLVLADWMDDHGEHDRAEFVRLQLRLAPGSPPLGTEESSDLRRRCQMLLGRNGGWGVPPSRGGWHRGLLTLRVPVRRGGTGPEAFAWADTLLFAVAGREGLRRAGRLLGRSGANHAGLD